MAKLSGSGITGVLLAAGFSRRYGANKLLAEIEGQPLIKHSAAALAPCDRIIVVVRADDTALRCVVNELEVEAIYNPQASRGMGYSIACAVNATSQSDGWCILPADMPCVKASTTQQLIGVLRAGATLAAPFYAGRRGHPVGFASCFLQELATLDDDTGGRRILERNRDQLHRVKTTDTGVLYDIDTPVNPGIQIV